MNTFIQELRQMRAKNIERTDLARKYLEFFPSCIYLKEELALAIWFSDPKKCVEILNDIETSRLQEEHIMRRIWYNRNHLLKQLSNDIEDHISTRIYVVASNPIPLVTFSITTCRRLNLFIHTMLMFLQNFKDHNLIHRWICIDDNSSDEDRIIMKEKFPFMEFVWKTKDNAGHAKSMQLISKMVTTPYLIHVEDDRFLINPRSYVADMINILEHDEHLGQVVFNCNYAETLDDNLIGGQLKRTKNNVYYFEHEYVSTEQERHQWTKKHGVGRHVNYYPHFSLSPSMIKTSIFDEISFEDVVKFEYNFAIRYTYANYKTAFLPGFHFEHRGRLTSEIHDPSKLNAYDLNNTIQFTNHTKYKTFIINLDSRIDRMNLINEQKEHLPPFERFSAVDGKALSGDLASKVKQLCQHGDYGMRAGVIGCALSHLKLFWQLRKDDNSDGYLIMEDDVRVQDTDVSFTTKVERSMRVLELKGSKLDIVFYSIVPKYYHHKFTNGVVKKNYNEACEFSIGGTGCYYISKRMAETVLEYIKDNGIDCPIDVILYRLLDHVNGYFLLPPTISQLGNTHSDIHNAITMEAKDQEPQDRESLLEDIFLMIN